MQQMQNYPYLIQAHTEIKHKMNIIQSRYEVLLPIVKIFDHCEKNVLFINYSIVNPHRL